MKSKVFSSIVTIMLVLSLTGCTASSQIQLLDAVTAAVDIALTTLSVIYPTALPPNVQTYVSAVLTGVSDVATELQTSDTAAQKASVIVKDLAALATAPNMAGIPPQVQVIISAIAAAVQAFVAPYIPTGPANAIKLSAYNPIVKLSYSDRSTLKNIVKKCTTLKTRVK